MATTTAKVSVKLEDSQLPTELKIILAKNHSIGWDEMYTKRLYEATFSTISTFLKSHMNKDTEKVGFKAVDFSGGFILGAIASYHAPEEGAEGEDTKGHWSLEYTTDESEMTDIKNVYDSLNNEFGQLYEQGLWETLRGRFFNNQIKQIMFINVVNLLIDFLSKNCKDDGSEFEVILDDFFTATIAMEDNAPVIAIVPGAVAKQLIKNDAVL